MSGTWRKRAISCAAILTFALTISGQPAKAADDVAAIIAAKEAPAPAYPAETGVGGVANAADIAAGAAVAQGPCRVLPVQAGYGVRANNAPAVRPDCDQPGAAVNAPIGQDLTYHGGPTVSSATHYRIAMNNSANCPNNCFAQWGDPYGFMVDLFASPTDIIHQLDQFTSSTANGRYTSNATFAYITVNNTPHKMLGADVNAAVQLGMRLLYPNGGGGGYDKMYHLFLVSGQDVCFNATSCYSPDDTPNFTFCAYHTWATLKDTNNNDVHVIYSVEPYQNVSGCQTTGGPNGTLTDSTNSVLSHEIFEAMSDPDLNAWYYQNLSGENGDLCNTTRQNPITLNGKKYDIQQEYSNNEHGCRGATGAKPSNDDFSSPYVQCCGTTSVLTTIGAVKQTGEPDHAGRAGGASIWYSYTPTKSGKVRMSTYSSSFDTVLAVYTGSSVNSLTLKAQNDDCSLPGEASGLHSCVDVQVVAGTTYRIALDGYLGARGTATLYTASPIDPAATHDFDGDNKSDIIWRDQSGNIGLWLMNGTTIASSAGFYGNPLSYGVVGQRDFNGDGNDDLLWRGPNGETVVWYYSGGSFTGVGINQAWPTTWSVAGTGKFDGDSRGDILWRNSNGDIAIWLMNTNLTIKTIVQLGNLTTAYTIRGVGDFDGDGISDIIFMDTQSSVAIWLMNSGGTVKTSKSYGQVGAAWSIVGTGDFDGDGKSDVLFRDTSSYVAIWLMNGVTVADSAVYGPIGLAWSVVETGDYNLDGKSDIVFRDTSYNAAVWFMNGKTVASSAALPDPGAAWIFTGANAD